MKRVLLISIFGIISFLPKETRAKDTEVQETYVIQPGDTLWGIAGKFYGHPEKWKKIHQANPGTKDPDLIYPGEKLVIPGVAEGEKQVKVEEIVPVEEKKLEAKPIEKKEIVSLPASTVTAVAPIPVKEEKKKVKFVPGSFLAPAGWQFDGLITGEKEKKILISVGDTVSLNIGSKGGVKAGTLYFVCRKKEKVRDPKTGKIQGQTVEQIGLLEITDEVEEKSSWAKVLASNGPIGVGDGIKVRIEE